MKNHVWQDGQLLQTNKKWSALKEKQKAWIYQVTAEEHASYVAVHGRLPIKERKSKVLDRVHERMNERGIWIPYPEFRTHVNKAIDRINRKSPLFPSPKQQVQPKKKKPQRYGFKEFPEVVQESVKETFRCQIERYIEQTHKLPPNKIRDTEIKQFLRGFNSKRWKTYGMLMQESMSMELLYDELRTQIYEEKKSCGSIPITPSKSQREHLRKQRIVLETDRLLLRKMNGQDYKEIRKMLSDLEVMYAWEHTFDTKKEVMGWIIGQLRRYEKDFVGYFAAVEKESEEIIGQIGLMWNEIKGRRSLEIGYILKKSCWGKGFATEGAKASMDYGFALFQPDKICASIRPENKLSIAVAERLGMTVEGEYSKKYNGRKMKHLIYTAMDTRIIS